MDETAKAALDLAFTLSARNPTVWGDDAILTTAGKFRDFLTDKPADKPQGKPKPAAPAGTVEF